MAGTCEERFKESFRLLLRPIRIRRPGWLLFVQKQGLLLLFGLTLLKPSFNLLAVKYSLPALPSLGQR